MKNILKLSSMALILALTLAGCGAATVQNVPQQPITAELAKTNSDVFNAIKKAGAPLGWIIKETGEGVAEGTLYLRNHVAIIDIAYNTKAYSITYKSSQNLGYNAENNTIHSNYNGWIQNLNNAIRVQLSLL